MIGIVDYGAGNVGSILNMLNRLGQDSKIVSCPEDIVSASKLILPGVGHFKHGMDMLNLSNFKEALTESVLVNKIPILGICLGAQLMTKSSEEGNVKGLGWLDAEVKRFNVSLMDQKLPVPHMGWNKVIVNEENNLSKSINESSKYYFVHSYHMKANDPSQIMLSTHYGYEFTSAMCHENVYALQFHPEKSHVHGLKIFQDFIDL